MAEPAVPASFDLSRAGRLAVFAMLAFVALFLAASLASGGQDVLGRLTELAPQVIAVLCVLSLLNYLARALRWQVLGRRLGISTGWRLGGLYYVAGFSMTATPGKIGEALRLWLLKQSHGYRYEHTISLLVADRLSDMAAIVLLCLAGIAAYGTYLWSTAVAALLTVVLIALFLQPRLAISLLSGVYARVGRWPRLFARLRTAARHAGRLASWRTCVAVLALSLLGWFAEAIAFHWLLTEFETGLGLGQSLFIFAFSMFVGALAMLPGGLGGTEASMVGLLLAGGVDLDVAVAATAVIRVTTLWFAVALGFLALPISLRLARGDRRSNLVESVG